MTREILNQVAKAKKINLNYYDHVSASIDENYKFVNICFFCLEVLPGGQRRWCGAKWVKISVAAILKRMDETAILPEDYETTGGNSQWIYQIR